MRKTIYVSDDNVWDLIKAEADKQGVSISFLLLSSWMGTTKNDQLERIESKLDQLICGFGDRPVANYEHKRYVEGWTDPRDTVIDSDGKTQNEVISEHLKNQTEDIPSKIITKGSSVEDIRKLDSKITAHRIKTAKGPVKANAALENFFKPQPKAKWRGGK